MQPLVRLSDWLSHTALSQLLSSAGWIVPAVQSIHILAIGLVIAPAILLSLRLLGIGGRDQPAGRLFASLGRLVWVGLLVLLLSGAMLIVAEPHRQLLNLLFQIKMGLLIAAILVTAYLQCWAASSTSAGRAAAKPFDVRAAGIIALLLWIAIIGCGRWIAYFDQG